MRRPITMLAALAAAFGCQPDNGMLSPQLDPGGGIASVAMEQVHQDSADPPTTDSTATAEQCELVEIDMNGGGTQEVYLCQRGRGARGDANADAATDGTTICWYWVTEFRIGGILVSRTEELLFCEELDNADGCDDEQRKIAQEYEDYDIQEREHPDCSDIEYKGAGTANFTWDELNGYFEEGNPHTDYGWVQQSLKSGIQGMRDAYGPLPLSSGYRCPHGNLSIPHASPKSWHMEGRAADISVKSLAGVDDNWNRMTKDERARVEAIWNDLDEIARASGAMDLQPFTAYADRHYHAAW